MNKFDIFGIDAFIFTKTINTFFNIPNIALSFLFLLLVFIIPIIALMYVILKISINSNINDNKLSKYMLYIWVISITGFLIMFSIEAHNFLKKESYVTSQLCSNKTIYIKTTNNIQTNSYDDIDLTQFNIYLDKNSSSLFGKIRLNISSIEDSIANISICRTSFGKSTAIAMANAKSLVYEFKTNDTIILNQYFTIPKNTKWRFPSIEINIQIPKNYRLYFNKQTVETLNEPNSLKTALYASSQSEQYIRYQ